MCEYSGVLRLDLGSASTERAFISQSCPKIAETGRCMEMRLEGGGRGQIAAGISRSSGEAKWRKFIKQDLLNHLSNINSMSKLRKMRLLVLTWKPRLQEGEAAAAGRRHLAFPHRVIPV